MSAVTSFSSNQRILHCWKEIADYLSAGVRTVQRWEAEFALPVRRPRGAKRSAVLAFSSEIDEWVKTLPAIAQNTEARPSILVVDRHQASRVAPAARGNRMEQLLTT
ncbi:MAG TPA: hypothetical protein VF532_22210 [Candidatus Angelobacter sp.]